MDSPGPYAAARSLTQGRHEIHGVTGSSCVPRTVLGYASCLSINGSVPFHSQKCPGLDNKLYGHPVIHVK